MTIFTVMFDVDKCKTWSRLLRVFRESVHKHMPDTVIIEKRIPAPERNTNHPKRDPANTRKLQEWVKYLETARDETIFMDCDMLCTGDASKAFEHEFDVAVTFRPEGSIPPMNGGVVFTRPTGRAIEFFRKWLEVNMRMYDDHILHHTWRNKWFGMNQAAFGYMYENGMCSDIKKLPTKIYNAVDNDWCQVVDDTVFVHMKSELRRAIISNVAPYGAYKRILEDWYSYDKKYNVAEPEKKAVRSVSVMNPKKIRYRTKKKRGRHRNNMVI